MTSYIMELRKIVGHRLLMQVGAGVIVEDRDGRILLQKRRDNGYWGYALDGKFVLQPLYDIAFDFSEEVALVKVGDVWHFIDVSGEVVITCGRGVGIKPFRNGVTRIVREDGVFEIYRDGRIVMVK